MRVRPDEERFAQPDLIRALTLTGTSEEIRDRIQAIEGGGYNQLAIQLVPGHESALEDWARVVEKL
jgi:hypothetical protein